MYRLMLIVQDDTNKEDGWTVIDYEKIKSSNNPEELYQLCHDLALSLTFKLASELARQLALRKTKA